MENLTYTFILYLLISKSMKKCLRANLYSLHGIGNRITNSVNHQLISRECKKSNHSRTTRTNKSKDILRLSTSPQALSYNFSLSQSRLFPSFHKRPVSSPGIYDRSFVIVVHLPQRKQYFHEPRFLKFSSTLLLFIKQVVSITDSFLSNEDNDEVGFASNSNFSIHLVTFQL